MRIRVPFLLPICAVAALTLSSNLYAVDAPHLDCDQMNTNFGEAETARATEQANLAKPATLHVQAAKNGGVHVRGWDGDHYVIVACKIAAGDDEADAKNLLSQIKLNAVGDMVTVEGPSGHHWSANLLIAAPNGSAMDVRAYNGPISMNDIKGTFHITAVNGPVGLQRVSGEVDTSAQNGPINLSGSSGAVRLQAQNGPVSVDITGTAWDGPELTARAENGPVELRVPKDFQTPFLVETQNGPAGCNADVCEQARTSNDRHHHSIEYGSGSPVLKFYSVNGPIAVKPHKSGL